MNLPLHTAAFYTLFFPALMLGGMRGVIALFVITCAAGWWRERRAAR